MNENNQSYTTKFTKDQDGNPFLELPDEILQALDWAEGSEIGIELFVDRIIFKKIV